MIIGMITTNDLILLAIFLLEAWAKDFSAQIKKWLVLQILKISFK